MVEATELILENLKTASEVIVRYKQPSIFYESSSDSKEVYEILKNYYIDDIYAAQVGETKKK